MKEHRRKRGDVAARAGSWKGRSIGGIGSSFSCTLTVVFCCLLLSALTFSTFQLFGVCFRPVLIATWQQAPALNAISGGGGGGDLSTHPHPHPHHPTSLYPRIHQAVSFPDQLVIYLNYPFQHSQFTPTATDHLLLRCLYFPPGKSEPNLNLVPISIDGPDPPSRPHHIVRCPLPPRGFSVSLSTTTTSAAAPPLHLLRWDSLVYESLLDHHDNTTVLFAKGLNLRQGRLSDPSRYECVYGWDFTRPKYLLSSPALTAAQEIVRCRTPLSILTRRNAKLPTKYKSLPPVMVSVRIKGRGAGGAGGNIILPSASQPTPLPRGSTETKEDNKHTMCTCTMVRNQARFMREWIAYHARVGVQRWFIYDNNSDDSLDDVVSSMDSAGYNVTRHVWPWVKTQEAGFAHCAIRAGEACRWVGFIDVDEFLYLPPPLSSSSSSVVFSLHDLLKNYSEGYPWVGELRTVCHSFGPSGKKTAPSEGVTVGYTCRMAAPERHKSIVRPEALSPALLNVVHHFQLKKEFRYVNVDRGLMVINHYKYQVWEVFKEKFNRRVATYVADWQDKENAGSKDRAPGLGTKPVEPPDWSTRFCEVNDTGLRDWVLGTLVDPDTGLLPWS